MLRELEHRLADVLGTRLPAPLAGAVDVLPGRPQARIALGVRRAEPFEDDLLSVRPERVPGANAARRVLRLRCDLKLEFRAPGGVTRDDQLSAIDRAVYLLGEASFRDGSVLLPADPATDPGFVLRSLRLVASEPPESVTLQVEGMFWPVGISGEEGRAIAEARVRQSLTPLRLSPASPALSAGGAPVELRIELGAAAGMRIAPDQTNGEGFGSLLVAVVDAGGRPGAGALSGGADGPDDTRALSVVDAATSVTYTPPAQAATDTLVVTLADAAGAARLELGRFRLQVRGA